MTDTDYTTTFAALAKRYGADIAAEATATAWAKSQSNFGAYAARIAANLEKRRGRTREIPTDPLPERAVRPGQEAYAAIGRLFTLRPDLVTTALFGQSGGPSGGQAVSRARRTLRSL